jgi:hypothetical protein
LFSRYDNYFAGESDETNETFGTDVISLSQGRYVIRFTIIMLIIGNVYVFISISMIRNNSDTDNNRSGWHQINYDMTDTGADPGFQVRGAHLKRLRRAEGGTKIFGVFCVKNRDFTPKNHIFCQFRFDLFRFVSISFHFGKFRFVSIYFVSFRFVSISFRILQKR